MSASHTVVSSFGMLLVSFEIWGRVELIGALTLGLSLLSLGLWLSLGRRLVRAQALNA